MNDVSYALLCVFAQILTFVVAITGFAPDLVFYTPLTKAGQLLVLKGHWTQESLRLYGCSEFVVSKSLGEVL